MTQLYLRSGNFWRFTERCHHSYERPNINKFLTIFQSAYHPYVSETERKNTHVCTAIGDLAIINIPVMFLLVSTEHKENMNNFG